MRRTRTALPHLDEVSSATHNAESVQQNLGTRSVAIVVDSAASLPPDTTGLYVVPMRLELGGRTYLDGVDLSPTDFYKMRRRSDRLPTTSAPSPAMFREAFEMAGSEASAVLCLTVAAKFSTSHESANAAADELRAGGSPTEFLVLDTMSAAGGQGLIAMESLRAALRGDSLDQVAEVARDMIARVSLLAIVDTLYYLWKGGRVPRLAHAGATLLSMKPIFELAGGEVRTRARPRTKRRAMPRLVDLIRERVGGRGIHAAIMHADAPEEAEELRERVHLELSCRESFVSEFTPVMGAHIGPGLLGVAYWAEDV